MNKIKETAVFFTSAAMILAFCVSCGNSPKKIKFPNTTMLTPQDAETWSDASAAKNSGDISETGLENTNEQIQSANASQSQNTNTSGTEANSETRAIANVQSEFETSVMPETEVSVEATGTDWESLYKSVLDKNKDSIANYDYIYIDDDDIPELMWTDGNFKIAQTHLYTIKNGKVYSLNTLSSYGSLNYIEKKGIIYTGDSSEGIETFVIYKLEGTTLNIISQGSSNRNTGATGDEQQNIVDGKNVTSEEFDKAYSQYINDPSYKTTAGKEYGKEKND